MSRFFPRDVIQWGEERLHPLRAFAIRAVEPAGITGITLRVWRMLVLGTSDGMLFVGGLVVGLLFLCGMLTWHLGNFPVKRWPVRAAMFVAIEVVAELGMSSLLIGFGRERIGSRMATWGDWWPMAAQTVFERVLILTVFALVLGMAVQVVRRVVDRRREPAIGG